MNYRTGDRVSGFEGDSLGKTFCVRAGVSCLPDAERPWQVRSQVELGNEGVNRCSLIAEGYPREGISLARIAMGS